MNKGGMEGTERQGGWRSPHTLSRIPGRGLLERVENYIGDSLHLVGIKSAPAK